MRIVCPFVTSNSRSFPMSFALSGNRAQRLFVRQREEDSGGSRPSAASARPA